MASTIKNFLKAVTNNLAPIITSQLLGRVYGYTEARAISIIPSIIPRTSILLSQTRIRTKTPRPTKVIVQEHIADRAGKHYDFRFLYFPMCLKKNGVLVSFATRKRPPSHFNDPKASKLFRCLFIRTNDHKQSYEKFQGIIRRGYGKGTVTRDFSSHGLVWSDENTISIYTPYSNNPWSGYWKIVRPATGNQYLAIRQKAFVSPWIPRMNYKVTDLNNITKDINTIAETKVDGANYQLYFQSPGLESKNKDNLSLNKIRLLNLSQNLYGKPTRENKVPFNISFVSRSKSVDNIPIVRSETMQHCSFVNLDRKVAQRVNRNVVRAELFHSKGISFLSGILNSLPKKAKETQIKSGYIQAMLFDIDGTVDNKNRFIPDNRSYKSRISDYTTLANNINKETALSKRINYNKTFFMLPERSSNIKQAYNQAIRRKGPLGEGIVIKSLDGNKEDTWLKVKKTKDYDLKVVGMTEGNNRLRNRMGNLLLSDKTGAVVARPGSGFTDNERQWWWDNRKDIIDKTVVTIKAQEAQENALRAPMFDRIRDDKSIDEIDFVPVGSHMDNLRSYLRGQGVTEDKIEPTIYKIKTTKRI